jgi:hypothetical protein
VAVAGLKHAVAQAIKKKKSRQQKKHKSVFVSSHERKRKKNAFATKCDVLLFRLLF